MTRRRFKLNAGRWAYVRRLALERDHYTCRECGRGGRMEVDHIQPKHKGGPLYALENLQSLCYGCHKAKTQGEFKARPDRPGYQEKWDSLMRMFCPPANPSLRLAEGSSSSAPPVAILATVIAQPTVLLGRFSPLGPLAIGAPPVCYAYHRHPTQPNNTVRMYWGNRISTNCQCHRVCLIDWWAS